MYLARLGGAVLADGRILLKIGRSADVSRRMAELNAGLPSPLGLRWRSEATWSYRDAVTAHAAEQEMLARWSAAGWSAGSEFLAVDADGLSRVAGVGPVLTGRSARPRPPTDPVRQGSPGGRMRHRARRRD